MESGLKQPALFHRLKQMSKLTDRISEAAQPVISALGLNLWDVEYLKEGGQNYLRVYIDRSEGVSLDDCEAVSKALDPIIDELDPIPDSYIFEVSSAGAERTLKRPGDFELGIGREVVVKLYRTRNGKKEFSGTLSGYDRSSGDVTVTIDESTETFTASEIAKIHLSVKL
jgi:ribosome maturation factor RimP